MDTLRSLALAVTALFLAGCEVNNIPTLHEQVDASWAEVENQYQRRADLVPNLVKVVKAASNYERDTLEAVVNARSRITSTQNKFPLDDSTAMRDYTQAQADLGVAIGGLLAYVESYPDLQANRDYLTLMSQLEGTENRIAVARRNYLATVALYNTELATFPGRIWAATLYRDNAPIDNYYEATADNAAQAPAVAF
jgi:LemA protein